MNIPVLLQCLVEKISRFFGAPNEAGIRNEGVGPSTSWGQLHLGDLGPTPWRGLKRQERNKVDPVKVNQLYLDVSENRGTPKWMVYNGKPY